jgi:hypothetical protein
VSAALYNLLTTSLTFAGLSRLLGNRRDDCPDPRESLRPTQAGVAVLHGCSHSSV